MVSFTPRSLNPGIRASATLWTGGCVGPRASPDMIVKRKEDPSLLLPGIETRSFSP